MRAKLSEQKSNDIMKTQDIYFENFDKDLKSKRYSISNKFLAFIFSGTCYFNKLNIDNFTNEEIKLKDAMTTCLPCEVYFSKTNFY